MGQSQSGGSDPSGVPYLKTFQALYQIAELVTGLIVWALLATGPYYKYGPLSFALGALLLAWIITLLFFVTYFFGLHIRINEFFSSRASSSGGESGESTSGSLAPPSGKSVPQIRWFVVEYVLYFIMSVLLFVAAVCMTAQLHNHKVWFAACALGWFLAVMYEIHFCLLFRNVESLWPYEWFFTCFGKCCPKPAKPESERLITDTSGASQPSTSAE